MVLLSYIDNLVSNINIDNIPKNIDLILDGGGFNGIYQLGALMYLRHLEEKKYLCVKRISGTSIGAFMGVVYILNKIDYAIEASDKMLKYFREHLDVRYCTKGLTDFLNEHMKKDDYLLINNRLYITYFNNKTKKQVIKNKYKSNEDLIEQITKSAYLPFLSGLNPSHDNSVDGINPYIFKRNNRKSLFIRLMSHKQASTSLNIKYEINSYGRILEGVLDINKFFTTGQRTILCSYVDEWSIIDFGLIRFKEIIWVILLIILDILLYINKKIPNKITESTHFIKIKTSFSNFYKDIFSHMLT